MSCVLYRTVPLSMTLNVTKPQFQGHSIDTTPPSWIEEGRLPTPPQYPRFSIRSPRRSNPQLFFNSAPSTFTYFLHCLLLISLVLCSTPSRWLSAHPWPACADLRTNYAHLHYIRWLQKDDIRQAVVITRVHKVSWCSLEQLQAGYISSVSCALWSMEALAVMGKS